MKGHFFLVLACLLWGTDSVFRYWISDSVDSGFIVFAEHLFGILFILPWVLIVQRKQLFQLSKRALASALFVGLFGSALGTTLFTLSFRYVNPSVAILLQKLQPILVVVLAFIMLGEKPSMRFFLLSPIAIGAGIVLSFPDLHFDFTSPQEQHHLKGIIFAFTAALFWGASTVIGKILLKDTPASVGAFWRYFFAFIALGLYFLFQSNPMPWASLWHPKTGFPIFYVSTLSGVIPMALYYVGLARTPASITTMIELIYPLASIVLNQFVLGIYLSSIQWVAALLLVWSVTEISRVDNA